MMGTTTKAPADVVKAWTISMATAWGGSRVQGDALGKSAEPVSIGGADRVVYGLPHRQLGAGRFDLA